MPLALAASAVLALAGGVVASASIPQNMPNGQPEVMNWQSGGYSQVYNCTDGNPGGCMSIVTSSADYFSWLAVSGTSYGYLLEESSTSPWRGDCATWNATYKDIDFVLCRSLTSQRFGIRAGSNTYSQLIIDYTGQCAKSAGAGNEVGEAACSSVSSQNIKWYT
jgi:hypothetical protein